MNDIKLDHGYCPFGDEIALMWKILAKTDHGYCPVGDRIALMGMDKSVHKIIYK